MKFKKQNEKGFCMLEIFIAMIILSIALMTLSSFSRATILMRQFAKGSDAAYSTAQQKLSALKAETFPASSGIDSTIIDKTCYVREWTINDTGYIQKATIVVSWNTIKGRQSLQFSGGIN